MITYHVTEDDFVAAHQLHFHTLHLIFLVIGLAGLVVGIVVYFFFKERWGAEAIGAAVFWLLYHRYDVSAGFPKRVRKLYAEQPRAGEPGEISWDDEYLEERHPNDDTKRKWTDYVRFVENEELMVLYIDKERFEIFPKRFFKEAGVLEGFRRNAGKAGGA
jgi:hypothetical protein